MPPETTLRLAIFLAFFTALALWERLAPRRRQAIARRARWPANLGVVVIDSILLRILFPTAAVGIALLAEAHAWGLFHWLAVPLPFATLASVVLLDLAIYAQHVTFHAVPTLWRLHRMHHTDLELDVTTALRFHPAEIILSMLIKCAAVALLGAPAAAVLTFEILLNATAMFNHANVRLPLWLDRPLRLLLVTPDMHRIHHSAELAETNSNYGFALAWWDRLFRTYRAEPAAGQQRMVIGLPAFRDPRELRLDRMLTQPLRDER